MRGHGVVGSGLLVLVSACCAAGSRGTLAGAGPDTRFASDPARVVVKTERGIEEIGLDGSGQALLFAGSFRVLDVSPDRAMYLLSDGETNLLVGDRRSGATRRVTALDRRMSAASFSPDGKTIAAVRHADFSLPQASWKDDDSVFLIDTATLAVDTIPPSSDDWPASVRWSTDGKALWLPIHHERPAQWITLASRARTHPGPTPPSPVMAPPFAPPSCPAQLVSGRESTELSVKDTPSDPPRVLVRLVGRKRGFHDYQDDFNHLALAPRCDLALFENERRTWVVDVKSGAFGPLIEGSWLFFEGGRAAP